LRELLIENCGWIYPVNTNEKGQITESTLNNIVENKESFDIKKDVPLEVYAVLQKADVKNENGRIYPKKMLEREVQRYKTVINQGSSIGETNHPNTTTIDLNNLSVWITDIWWDGITVMGKLKLPVSRGFIESGICSLPADAIATYLAYGIKIGISSRGVGSVKSENNEKIVQDDFEMLCWDFVNNPSTRNAWVDTELKNLDKYVESIETSPKNVVKQDDKYDKITHFIKKYGN
jgi:hypothetical protein